MATKFRCDVQGTSNMAVFYCDICNYEWVSSKAESCEHCNPASKEDGHILEKSENQFSVFFQGRYYGYFTSHEGASTFLNNLKNDFMEEPING